MYRHGLSLAAMRIQRKLAFLLLLSWLNLLCPLAFSANRPTNRVADGGVSGTPTVHKLEPPTWWVNYTPELTLLITGENLSGGRVESPTKNVIPLGAEGSANGHYLFVHLKLTSELLPGTIP